MAGEPVPGTILNHLFPFCRKGSGRGYTPTTLIPDKSCVTVPGLSLEIQKPATCANGTLARIALFDDKRCNHGEVTREDGFINVAELSDYCLDMRAANYGSMMFYCDGPTPKEHKPDENDENDDKDEEPAAPLGPKKGSLSDNSCYVRGQPMQAPTFKHPKPDTCVNIPAHRQVKVYHSAVCADGRPAEFARYSGYGCQGEPTEKNMIGGQSECMSLSEMDQFDSSVAFVCDGVKQGAVRVNDNNNNKSESGGSIIGFVLVVVLIVALTILSCALACLRSVNIVTKIMSLFRSNEGQISLS